MSDREDGETTDHGHDTEPFDTIDIDAIPDAIVIADAETRRIVRTNRAAVEMFGYERGALLGGRQTELHPSENTEEYIEAFHRGLDGQRVNRLQSGAPVLIVTADGETVPVEINVQRLTAGGDEYLMGIFREASAQLAREQAFTRATSELEALLDHVPIPVSLFDTNGIVKRWNHAAERKFGYTTEQIVGQQVGRFTDNEEFSSLLDRVTDGEALQNYRMKFRKKGGSVVSTEVNIAPIYVEGAITGVVVAAIDTSDRRQREQQLAVLYRMIRHNLRNELNVIRGWAEEITIDTQEDERAVTKVVDASDRLWRLADDIVDIPRVREDGEQSVTARQTATLATKLSEKLHTNGGVVDVETAVESTAGQVQVEAVQAMLDLCSSLLAPDDNATVTLMIDSLDTHTKVSITSNKTLLSKGQRIIIQQGTEDPLQHASEVRTAQSYLTIQAIGGTVTLQQETADAPATDLRVEIPRVDV